MPRPKHKLVTVTHCSGYCMDCSYRNLTQSQFERGCLTGQSCIVQTTEDGGATLGKETTIYKRGIPNSAIHLVRDPFDNLVARMHLFNKHHLNRPQHFTSSRDGFLEWCQYLDKKYPWNESNITLPCRAEWTKYVMWHNLAWQTTRQSFSIPVHYLFYENYQTQYNETMQELLKFLQSDMVVNESIDSRSGSTYRQVFDTEHQQAAKALVQELALPEVWKLLRRYFVSFEGDKNDDDTVHLKEIDDMEDLPRAPKKASSINIPLQMDPFVHPEVVWLLSFPNSVRSTNQLVVSSSLGPHCVAFSQGTSYTILNTESASQRATASNYAISFDELVAVRPEWQGNGPYLHRLDLPIGKYVLTKTHCTGYCNDCSVSRYARFDYNSAAAVDLFERGCQTGSKYPNVATLYETVPVRVVHLLRNPFDNLVSRYHLAVRNHHLDEKAQGVAPYFYPNATGFHTFCSFMEYKYGSKERTTSLIPFPIKALFRRLPCHADFYRYTIWHNLALQMIQRSNMSVHTLYYEDYFPKNYNLTVDKLLEFLELHRLGDTLPFVAGKTYADSYYSSREMRLARRLVKYVATPETWALIGHYFDGIVDEE